jgi:monofunctional biosynthetic peptidoglycan transglycosylase
VRWLRRLLMAAFVVFLLLPLGLTLIFRWLPPPVTPLMVIRWVEGYGIRKDWTPIESISPNLLRAVIASEDAKFCTHSGFDWAAIDNAIDRYEEGGKVLGASTISMQTAKNVFLWPGRNFVRKGLEAWLTLFVEQLWPKRRILEIYLNIAEWGEGIYGAEAAARHHFRKSAKSLTSREAALLALVLPDPLDRSAARPGAWMARRAETIQARMQQVRLEPGTVCP